MKPYSELTKRGQIGRIKQLARTALSNYDLDVVNVQPLVHGENTTFRIDTDSDRFVLRVNRPGYRSLAQISSEMAWLAAINHDTALIVPRPVANRASDYVTSAAVVGVPETRHCVIFQWVYGRFHRRNPRPVYLERVGRATAVLHRHAQTYPLQPGNGLRDVEWNGEMQRIWDKGIDQAAITEADRLIFEQVRDITRIAFDQLGYNEDVYGLIHADLHLANVLFADGEARIIDFDDCGFGHFLNDLTITLWYLRTRPNFEMFREALLNGYVAGGGVVSADAFALIDTINASRTVLMALYIAGRTDHPVFREVAPRYTHRLADDLRRFLNGEPQIGAGWG